MKTETSGVDRSVNVVTAFGRSEALALSLQDHGFHVRLIDFTSCFPASFHHGLGPFPLVQSQPTGSTGDKSVEKSAENTMQWLEGLEKLPSLSVWRKSGPIDLSGPLTDVHAQSDAGLRTWLGKSRESNDFENEWLRSLLKRLTSPVERESWEQTQESGFPAGEGLFVAPGLKEASLLNFDRWRAKGFEYVAAKKLLQIGHQGSLIQSIVVEKGSSVALSGGQWIWCLTSKETANVSAQLDDSSQPPAVTQLFYRGVAEPLVSWISFEGQIQYGPWTESLPKFFIALEDHRQPFRGANLIVARRLDNLRLRFWLKVPQVELASVDARRDWAMAIQQNLLQRLPQAQWALDAKQWSQCPHSVSFEPRALADMQVRWKNWHWLAPETLPRLDFAARFEKEQLVYKQLVAWRSESLRKKGVAVDPTLHTP